MSGRGKGGKGLGAGRFSLERLCPLKAKQAEAYEWKDGEGIVVISYANSQDGEIQIYSLPEGRVHPLLKPAVKASSDARSQIYIQLSSDDDENSDLFDNLTAKDIRKWQNGEEGDDAADDAADDEEEGEEEEEEEEEEIDGDEKGDLLESISTWVATLDPWQKNPPTAVKIACRISVWESA